VIEHRRPDIVVVEKDNKTALLIDNAVPGDTGIEKEQEKLYRYQNLARELKRLWKTNTDIIPTVVDALGTTPTRRPASTDRTARRHFQATVQPVSRTQASDAMTSRLPRYEAKCVQRRCFQCASVPLRSHIKRTELPPANILIQLKRQLIVHGTTLPLRVFI